MSRRKLQPAKPPPVLDFGMPTLREPLRVPLRITRAQLAALADGETVVVPISMVQEGALRLADE